MDRKKNTCENRYKPGTLWKTRRDISAFSEYSFESIKPIIIPAKEYVMVLSYFIDLNRDEHVILLWKEKMVSAFHIDSAHDFEVELKT